MSCVVGRMSPRDRTGSPFGLVLMVAFACAVGLGTVAWGEEGPGSGSARDSAGAMRLPPRNGTDSPSAPARKSTATNGGIWTTVISLGVIVGGLVLVGYWLKPYAVGAHGLPIEAMELLGRRVIEQKVAIHLVRCGGRVLVLGVSPEGARTLSEITDPAEVNRLVAACHAPREQLRTSATRASSIPTEDTRRG